MNDHELDTLVARTANVTDAEIEQWVRGVPFDELCEDIMSTTSIPAPEQESAVATATTPLRIDQHRPRRRRRIAALATTAAAILGLGLVINVRSDDGRSTAWAAPLVDFAKHSPLLLLQDWQVTRADESNDYSEGEMTFASGDREAELNWRPGPLDEWIDDRAHSSTAHGEHTVVNGVATVFQYDDSLDFTGLWLVDGRVLEFRAVAASVDEYKAMLDSLVAVDSDEWLGAMPVSVITNVDQGATINEMLVGIPLPAGFDVAALATDDAVKDRYQLGAHVVGQISCVWIAQWLDATSAGDAASAQAALDAMSTSSTWPILQEMNESGAYGEVLQWLVDQMVDGEPTGPGTKNNLAENYRAGLGCDR